MPIYKVDGVKKDGLQKYKVRVNFIGDNGQSKSYTRVAYGREAATDLERTLNNDIKTRGETQLSKISIQELFDEYILSKKYEVREATTHKNQRNFRLYIKDTLADIRIDKITPRMLQSWKTTLDEKGLALKTKRHAYALLKSTFNYALSMDYVEKNLLTKDKVGNFKETLQTQQKMNIYTSEDFVKYIAAARKAAEEKQILHNDLSEWNYYVFFCIAFYTGLRKGEIHALTWNDIEGSYLSVGRSVLQGLKGGDRETAPKNKSSIRILQMPAFLVNTLNEHKKRQKQLKYFTESYRICGGERCLRNTSLENKNKHYAKLSNLKKIRIHDFRHSHVSVLANEGINIQEIARRLGHSKIEMTWNTYSHMYPREEEKAVGVLDGIM